jgi:curved DNA-binding protein CbpA
MLIPMKNYYKILGVVPGADAKAIKAAYRRLARTYHPDVARTADMRARFPEIQEAASVLLDPERRQIYDDALRSKAARPRPRRRRPAPDLPDVAGLVIDVLGIRISATVAAGRPRRRRPAR